MKTAIQEAIDNIHKCYNVYDAKDLLYKLLEEEKEQIIEAFKHGELPPLFCNYNAEEYYNQTYNK
jgi:hypothetical protein